MKRTRLLILGLALSLFLVSCGGNQPEEKPDDQAQEQEEVEEVEVTREAYQIEDPSQWPQSFMPSAPVFPGTIDDMELSEDGDRELIFIVFRDVERDEAEAYVEKIKESGFLSSLFDENREDDILYRASDGQGNTMSFSWDEGGLVMIQLIR